MTVSSSFASTSRSNHHPKCWDVRVSSGSDNRSHICVYTKHTICLVTFEITTILTLFSQPNGVVVSSSAPQHALITLSTFNLFVLRVLLLVTWALVKLSIFCFCLIHIFKYPLRRAADSRKKKASQWHNRSDRKNKIENISMSQKRTAWSLISQNVNVNIHSSEGKERGNELRNNFASDQLEVWTTQQAAGCVLDATN